MSIGINPKAKEYVGKFKKSAAQVYSDLSEELQQNPFQMFRVPSDFSRNELSSVGLTLKYLPNALMFLSLVRIICNHKKRFNKENPDSDPYARIHSMILSNYILTLNHDTKKFLTTLEEIGWIEIDNKYLVGKTSKGYRIGPRFKKSEWKVIDWRVYLDSVLPELQKKSIIARKKETIYRLWHRASTYFFSWKAMPEGTLKEICAKTEEILKMLSVVNRAELEEMIISCAKETQLSYLNQKKNKSQIWTEDQRIQNYKDSIAAIEDKDFTIVCHSDQYADHTDRIFTNWTNCKKEFKQFFLLGGEKMVSVDIKSCQPALLAAFYNESEEDQKEKLRYLDILINQDIYLYLSDDEVSRELAKTETFKVMFDKNCRQTTPFCLKFAKEFPILAERIRKKKEGNHKLVAREMQLNESKIMVWGVLNTLLFEHKITCLSVHDSISCLEKDVEIVKAEMVKFFQKEMNFQPVLKIEN